MSDDTHTDHLVKLRTEVGKLPRLPGVYLMRDRTGSLIYVGKARDLRARVRTYFSGGDGRSQIEFLIRRVHSIEKIVTENEEQALVLERDLINKHKPRYNIRLKDDKAYLNVRIDRNAEWPRIELVRKVEQDGAQYFGPYTASMKLYGLLEVLRNVVPLRSCSDTVFYNRQRPCLEYQIKRCAGPCCMPVDREQYQEWVDQAIAMLQGKLKPIIQELEERMEQASEDLRFEEAAIVRDRIAALDEYARGAQYVQHHAESRDVWEVYREGSLATLCMMRVRSGRISDSEVFALPQVVISNAELLESVLLQYYTGEREIPEEIVLPYSLLDEKMVVTALRKRRGGTVNFTIPQRGSKFRLLQLAAVNAEHAHTSKFDAEARYQEIARELSIRCELGQVPRRIECVDISNLQGSDIVGAIVCFFDGHPLKSEYKRYRIKTQGKPDDFQSMHEVVMRRLQRAKESGEYPDLLIIDGGAGQLKRACEARDDLGLNLDIIALAKERVFSGRRRTQEEWRPERIYLTGRNVPMPLAEGEEVTQFLTRVRDEAHRFVISYHRASRAKRVMRSILDEIPGVGPERRKRLLTHFGGIAKIAAAAPEEVARVGRMPRTLAQKIITSIQRRSS